mmetsp:Transcript_4610/g.18437  ORF Transcript_4610/g.18437 Transcript_4610/m.18437 type:complete len:208 (+) Transcript_4610:531-1154(+)
MGPLRGNGYSTSSPPSPSRHVGLRYVNAVIRRPSTFASLSKCSGKHPPKPAFLCSFTTWWCSCVCATLGSITFRSVRSERSSATARSAGASSASDAASTCISASKMWPFSRRARVPSGRTRTVALGRITPGADARRRSSARSVSASVVLSRSPPGASCVSPTTTSSAPSTTAKPCFWSDVATSATAMRSAAAATAAASGVPAEAGVP